MNNVFEILVANDIKQLVATTRNIYSVIRERKDFGCCFELVGQVQGMAAAEFLMKDAANNRPNDSVYIYRYDCSYGTIFKCDEILR
jgi:hypothetical protein